MSMIWTAQALWRREIVKFIRDYNRVVGAILQPLVIWLLLGFGFRDTFRIPSTDTGAAATGVPYLEFLFPGILALVALFTSIFSTISIVEERKSGFLQAALASPAPRSALVLGTILGGTTLAVIEGLVFIALLPTMDQFPSAIGLVLMLFVTFLIGISFTALGVVIAWKTSTTRGFHAVMNLFLMPLWVLSGAFFPAAGAPDILQWIIRFNPISYGVDALRRAMYLPAEPPLAAAPLVTSIGVTVVFAALMFAFAVRTVTRASSSA